MLQRISPLRQSIERQSCRENKLPVMINVITMAKYFFIALYIAPCGNGLLSLNVMRF